MGESTFKKLTNIETGLECEYWSTCALETGVCECTCKYKTGITGMNRTGLEVCECVDWRVGTGAGRKRTQEKKR